MAGGDIAGLTRDEQVREAARELAGGASQKDTATKLGIHRTTVRKWCSDPDFLEEFEAETLRLQRAIYARVLKSADKAMDTLDKLMTSDEDRIKLGAAKAVITATDTTRPPGLGDGGGGGGPQVVIIMGTPEGDAEIAAAKARVVKARKATLPAGGDHG